jgi:ABC-type sulfate/molybdate transport systems ATPase subunit
MAIAFRRVTSGPLQDFDAAAPDGVVVGIVGENGSGKGRLIGLAAGEAAAASGSVERSGAVRRLGPDDALDLTPIAVLLIEHTFARQDALERERAALALDGLRRAGTTTLLVSHEEDLLRRLSDEVWWLHEGKLAGCGDPGEVLAAYRRHTAQRLRAWGETAAMPLEALWRRGDGRAEIVSVETIGESGHPTLVWRSGELAVVKVRVRFRQAVADPVHEHGAGEVEAGSLRGRRRARDQLRVPLRALPGELYSDGGLARSRWAVARLAGRRGFFRGGRRPLYGGGGEPAGHGYGGGPMRT